MLSTACKWFHATLWEAEEWKRVKWLIKWRQGLQRVWWEPMKRYPNVGWSNSDLREVLVGYSGYIQWSGWQFRFSKKVIWCEVRRVTIGDCCLGQNASKAEFETSSLGFSCGIWQISNMSRNNRELSSPSSIHLEFKLRTFKMVSELHFLENKYCLQRSGSSESVTTSDIKRRLRRKTWESVLNKKQYVIRELAWKLKLHDKVQKEGGGKPNRDETLMPSKKQG